MRRVSAVSQCHRCGGWGSLVWCPDEDDVTMFVCDECGGMGLVGEDVPEED